MNRVALLVTLLAATFAAACGGSGTTPIPPPPTGNFSNASLKGQYAFSMSGNNGASGTFFARVGSFTADGAGNITVGIQDVNVTGVNETLAFSPSVYSVQANGRGTLNLTDTTGTLVFSITMLSPTQGLIVETDGIATASGTFVLQNANSFNAAGLSGNYVFDVSGLDGGQLNGNINPESIVGQFVSPGVAGPLTSGLVDVNDGAQLTAAATFTTSTFQIDATNGPTSGRGLLSFTANGIPYGFVFYIVNGSRVRMMELDGSGALTVGDAVSQSSVPASNTNFNGNFVFVVSGSGSSGAITRIGRFTADGNGGLGSIFADANDAGTVVSIPHGTLSATTYAIDTANLGNGRGTMTFTDSKLGTFQFVFYLSSSSGGVIQATSKNTVADGTLQLQTGGPFSGSSLAGDYGFNFSGVSTNSTTQVTAEEDYVGQFVLSSSASNNVSGAVDFSEFSSNQGVFTNIVVSGNGLTIGGDGTTSTGTRNAMSFKINTAPSSTLNFVPYFVNSQTMFVAGTDSDRTISGIINVQAP